MIKLTYLIKKRPDLSPAAFAALWRSTHANLVESMAGTLNARRYTMSSHVETVCNTCVKKARNLADSDYDGVIEIWWDSLEDYQAGAGSPPGLAVTDAVIDAERRFVDFSRSTAFFTEETVVFDRGAGKESVAPAVDSKANLSDQTTSVPIIN